MALSSLYKQRFRFVLTVYFGVVTLGFSPWMDAVNHGNSGFADSKQISNGAFSPEDYAIDFQAEDTAVISSAGGYSFSPVHKSSSRIITFSGAYLGGTAFVASSFKTITNINHSNTRNTILLKLRI
jgi:hypothetical protein